MSKEVSGSPIKSHIPPDRCRRCRYYNDNSRWHHCTQGAAGPQEPGCRYEPNDVHDSGDEISASSKYRDSTFSASDIPLCPSEKRQYFERYESIGMVKIDGKTVVQDARK